VGEAFADIGKEKRRESNSTDISAITDVLQFFFIAFSPFLYLELKKSFDYFKWKSSLFI
jgi:hypothetical protein